MNPHGSITKFMGRSRTRYKALRDVFSGASDLLIQIARLTVLFEDLQIDVAGFLAKEDDLGDMDSLPHNFRRPYFVRRSPVTLQSFRQCIGDICANEQFRASPHLMKPDLRSHVVDANSYFKRNRVTIDKYRNRFGGHLDLDSIRAGIARLENVPIGKLAFEEPRVGNFVLKNYFAVSILEASIISQLEPGIDLGAEYQAVLQILADSINHAQRATQALVYSYLWPKFG